MIHLSVDERADGPIRRVDLLQDPWHLLAGLPVLACPLHRRTHSLQLLAGHHHPPRLAGPVKGLAGPPRPSSISVGLTTTTRSPTATTHFSIAASYSPTATTHFSIAAYRSSTAATRLSTAATRSSTAAARSSKAATRSSSGTTHSSVSSTENVQTS